MLEIESMSIIFQKESIILITKICEEYKTEELLSLVEKLIIYIINKSEELSSLLLARIAIQVL